MTPVLEVVLSLPAISVFYAVLAGLFAQVALWAHLIGTGVLTALIDRSGLSGDYTFLAEMTQDARDRVRAVRAPALVLAVVTMGIAGVAALAALTEVASAS
jgi:hypothetical protein